MRWIGIIGVFAAFVIASADANDAKKPCYGLLEEQNMAGGRNAQENELLLTDNQCEARRSRELRLPLLEIPQEDNDPIALSLGAKDVGVTLRFKIPF